MSSHGPATLYFSPPPTFANDKDTKKAVKFSFRSRTQELSPSLKQPSKPVLRSKLTSTKRTRQWILLAQLILSFAILILSVIFAYCAALPHSANIKAAQSSAAAGAVGSNAAVDGVASVVSSTAASAATTSTVTLISATIATPQASQSQSLPLPGPGLASTSSSASQLPPSLFRKDTPRYTDDPISQIYNETTLLLTDKANQEKFNKPNAMAALTFYTATLPLLTMLHTSTELLTSLIRPQTSQATKLGDKLRFRAGADGAKSVMARRRTGALLSFCASTLLGLGWLVLQTFWVNCEITPFSGPSQGALASSESVCPVQIRGHRMGGISELSVAKVALGFCVVLVYGFYCFYLVHRVDVFGSSRQEKRGLGVGLGRLSSLKRNSKLGRVDEECGEGGLGRGEAVITPELNTGMPLMSPRTRGGEQGLKKVGTTESVVIGFEIKGVM